jgi:hypothetical protein
MVPECTPGSPQVQTYGEPRYEHVSGITAYGETRVRVWRMINKVCVEDDGRRYSSSGATQRLRPKKTPTGEAMPVGAIL